MLRKLKKCLKKVKFLRELNLKFNIKPNAKAKSYSQFGEDIIIETAFVLLKVDMEKLTYLDIGANHPVKLSNTFMFYDKYHAHGVLVEPDMKLCEVLRGYRDRDLVLNVGVGTQDNPEIRDFYEMSANVLNTFSKEEAEKIDAIGEYHIKKIIPITLYSFNYIMENYAKAFGGGVPDLVSLDIEGIELEILKSINFEKYRPKIFVIETLEFVSRIKRTDIIDFMLSKGYVVHADTFLNTIFIDKPGMFEKI